MYLSESFFAALPSSISHESTKFFTVFKSENKKSYFSGKRVQLLDFDSSYGPKFTEVTDEVAKLKHLGKVRCVGVVSSEYELLVVYSKYFSFIVPQDFPVSVEKEKHVVKKRKSKLELEIKLCNSNLEKKPGDRDEKDLVNSFRLAKTQNEKNKIFRIILFQRGVNGKTWDKIIQNYVFYNKHKFSHIHDRDEKDFYQDIVIALHKQVEKWFNTDKQICFSTYAWYVINCSFHRILQLLSTQKRKVSYEKSNIQLNNNDTSYDESISIENTMYSKSSFEDEFEQRNLCNIIKKMFELKQVDAPNELKQEVLKVIREKSAVHNSLYLIAKKYDVKTTEVFKLERILRENIKNAMFSDIITNMQYDINADEEIAKKYKRSKGHIIKMKKKMSGIVKSKLKEVL